MSSATTPRTSRFWRRSPRWLRRPMPRSSPRLLPRCSTWTAITELGQPARSGQDLPERGLCQVEVFPGFGRFPLCGSGPAAHPHPAALRAGNVPVESFNFEEDVDGTDHEQVSVGQCGLCPGHPADRCLRQVSLDRGHQGRRRRRPGAGAAGAYLQDR